MEVAHASPCWRNESFGRIEPNDCCARSTGAPESSLLQVLRAEGNAGEGRKTQVSLARMTELGGSLCLGVESASRTSVSREMTLRSTLAHASHECFGTSRRSSRRIRAFRGKSSDRQDQVRGRSNAAGYVGVASLVPPKRPVSSLGNAHARSRPDILIGYAVPGDD
jgi:hypothetical protein